MKLFTGGKTLYRGTTYISLVAVLNAVRGGKFSMSLNQRFESPRNETLAKSLGRLADWATGKVNATPLVWVSRRLFEGQSPQINSFPEAKVFLETTPLIRYNDYEAIDRLMQAFDQQMEAFNQI